MEKREKNTSLFSDTNSNGKNLAPWAGTLPRASKDRWTECGAHQYICSSRRECRERCVLSTGCSEGHHQ